MSCLGCLRTSLAKATMVAELVGPFCLFGALGFRTLASSLLWQVRAVPFVSDL